MCGRVQVKALLQEMANFEDAREPVNQYQSMYDMVKRRSNKEREKEDNLRAMESRAKSLNQIAQVPASASHYHSYSVVDGSFYLPDTHTYSVCVASIHCTLGDFTFWISLLLRPNFGLRPNLVQKVK